MVYTFLQGHLGFKPHTLLHQLNLGELRSVVIIACAFVSKVKIRASY